LVFSSNNLGQFGKALPVQVSHRFSAQSAVFDDDNLVSCAGLVPVMSLAAQTGLPQLLAAKVRIAEPKIKSGSANPAPKLVTLLAGMCAGADSIDDLDVVRCGGMKTVFDGVYAPSTIGTLLREFSFGHARQLESVLRHHLSALCGRCDLLPGADVRAFIDIDSLLRPVYGHAKQGASYGHTKMAGKQILRKGLSPLAATISTDAGAPVIAGMRLRAGRANSGKGAARMIAQAVGTARAAGVTGGLLVRGDSAYGTRAVIGACRRSGARFSLVLAKNTTVTAAIDAIPDTAWTPVRYPGAVRDPDTGGWISDAEVAEIPYTAFGSSRHSVTARLIVRRVKDARYPDALFPVWRYHPFFTDSDEPVTEADITHRRHAIIETVFADLIDGPLAHMPSGRFGANSAWILCAAIAHNLLRATGVIAGNRHAVARGATLRRTIVNIPARLARPQRRTVLHLPRHWPWAESWLALWRNIIGSSQHHPPPHAAPA
jgi:Transposase DDE domain group 1